MKIGVPKETFPGDGRVALPVVAAVPLLKAGYEILVQAGAGENAGVSDAEYEKAGIKLVPDRETVFKQADVILQVRGPGANPQAESDIALLREGQFLIAFLEPLAAPETAEKVAQRKVTSFAMELIPRITRAQSMDALSSMSTVAGYMAVLLAATHLPRFFPMFLTAAGTISAAKVLVIGAGVAGLQAIATARRLGALVEAYDTRPAVKDQVKSLGARFVELELQTADAEDSGGYAKAQSADFYKRQQELMGEHVRASDVVITTAAVPGRRAPVLIPEEVVKGMKRGSIVVDLAAEKGGNCALTEPGKNVERHGVNILAPLNLAARLPVHASQMYGRNVGTLLMHLGKQGKIELNLDDEITRGSMVTHDGKVAHPAVVEALGSPVGR
jgi:NAD(P) transhydrogenase subunit alpha